MTPIIVSTERSLRRQRFVAARRIRSLHFIVVHLRLLAPAHDHDHRHDRARDHDADHDIAPNREARGNGLGHDRLVRDHHVVIAVVHGDDVDGHGRALLGLVAVLVLVHGHDGDASGLLVDFDAGLGDSAGQVVVRLEQRLLGAIPGVLAGAHHMYAGAVYPALQGREKRPFLNKKGRKIKMADITVMNKQEQEISTGATQENKATQPLPVEPVTPVPSYVEGLTEDETDQEAVTTEEPKFLSLEEILGMDTADLTAEKQGFFHSEKLGDIPYTAISYDDYKQAKKDCVTYDQDENGVIQTKVDDDKLMTKIVILAVDKDQRSNFTFANGALLKKLGVHTAEGALSTLLPPGEIVNFAVAVQNASGFGNKAKKKVKDSVKNS